MTPDCAGLTPHFSQLHVLDPNEGVEQMKQCWTRGAGAVIGVLALSSWAHGQCPNDCGAGDVAEGEACLVDLAVDTTNGGCNSTPPVFTVVGLLSVTYCGTASTYDVDTDGDGIPDTDRRDTDWYLIPVSVLNDADTDGDGVVQVRTTLNSEFDGVTS